MRIIKMDKLVGFIAFVRKTLYLGQKHKEQFTV